MQHFSSLIKSLLLSCSLLLLWQATVVVFDLPHYMLPKPIDVLDQLQSKTALLLAHIQVTLLEILLGLCLGFLLGLLSALLLSLSNWLSSLLLPLLIVSQAIPVFAIAPLLVLWFGYGMASKIAMTILIIYFPVTAACYDGLRNTPTTWLELSKTMSATPLQILWRVRLPAALPSLASGLRIAVTIAPIGAVIGEWVGSNQGLGYLMLHANARMQVDLMFAALFVLMFITLLFFFLTDKLLRYFLPWANQLR
ncbi:ABC transporter permease [Gallibacterium sp. AGMB14963]|uniref:ABC transporter permease n=1 Tax=Gallibacterium faecale TaxID=3019086 RepID=UPI0022F1721E|nr:ABC transporter permease [Gallibacterium sp. AGMB14963]MDA3979778.1 ABC transporter permease [Gallibacterium sp. AGMB14963]